MSVSQELGTYYTEHLAAGHFSNIFGWVRSCDLNALACEWNRMKRQLEDQCSEICLIERLFITAVSHCNDLHSLYLAWQQLPTDGAMKQAASNRIIHILIEASTAMTLPVGFTFLTNQRSTLNSELRSYLDQMVIRRLAEADISV